MNKLKGLIYELVLWLAVSGARKSSPDKKILIVRIDEIGDYMLWHNFLKEIAGAEQYKGYQVHFCGNQSWRSLFENFDSEQVGHCLWLDKTRFKKDMPYRFSILKQVYREGYTVVINPTFSRDKRNDDSIVKAAKAPETLGMVANLESVREYEEGYDRNLYTRLFDHPQKPIFEFYRNRLFAEFITGEISQIVNTRVPKNKLPALPVSLDEKYFVIFPGSRSKARIWPTENFLRVSDYLFETHGWTAVVCGTSADAEYINAFCRQYKHPCINLMAKTSLTEMLTVFAGAKCLVSVDTGSVHLAASVECPVFGIFNGSQYKRFAPYPSMITAHFYAVYPVAVEAELANPELVKQKYEFVVNIPYALVEPQQVIYELHRHFVPRF